jgi:hypothetical protein
VSTTSVYHHLDGDTVVKVDRAFAPSGAFTMITLDSATTICVRDEYRPKLQELADKIAAYLAQQVEAA